MCEIDADYRIAGFEEKPQHSAPAPSRFNPEKVSASMGIYVFNTKTLLRALYEDAEDPSSSHDFGKDVIPKLLRQARVIAYNFVDMNHKEALYWRDVGTIDAYYEANMDLVAVSPEFNLYDESWPVRTCVSQYPPAKFVFAQEGRRMGVALRDSPSSAPDASSRGPRVVRSVLFPGVRVNSVVRCEVENSILMSRVEIGRYTRIRRAIICEGAKIAESQHAIGSGRGRRPLPAHVRCNGTSGIVVAPAALGNLYVAYSQPATILWGRLIIGYGDTPTWSAFPNRPPDLWPRLRPRGGSAC